MGILKKLAADTAIYGFSTIVARLINYLLVAYHTRVLDTAQYGIFTEFYSYITLLLVLLTYGMETGFFRFASLPNHNPQKVFSTSLVCLFATSSIFLLIILCNAPSVAAMMGYAHNTAYVKQLAAVVAIDAFVSIPFARLRLQRKAKTFALFKLLNVIFYVGINLLFFGYLPQYFSQNPNSVLLRLLPATADVGYVFFANLLASGFTLILLLPTIFSIKIKFSWLLLKQMLIYSLPLLVAGLPGIANDYIDRLLFRYLMPASEAMNNLGIYGANAKLAVLMVIFVQMFRYAAEPFFFSNSTAANRRPLFADVMKYFTAATVFIFLIVTLYLDRFALFMGKDFRAGVSIVPIMLFANLLFGIAFNLSIWYKLSGKTSMAVYITLTGLAVTVAVNLFFVPRYGYQAAAWAHLASNAAMVALSYRLGQRYYPVPYNLRRIGFYLALGLAIYGLFVVAGYFAGLNGVPKIVAATGLLMLYGGIVWRKERKLAA
jgi:O-antigen/teichoic acid export membrane protein